MKKLNKWVEVFSVLSGINLEEVDNLKVTKNNYKKVRDIYFKLRDTIKPFYMEKRTKSLNPMEYTYYYKELLQIDRVLKALKTQLRNYKISMQQKIKEAYSIGFVAPKGFEYPGMNDSI